MAGIGGAVFGPRLFESAGTLTRVCRNSLYAVRVCCVGQFLIVCGVWIFKSGLKGPWSVISFVEQTHFCRFAQREPTGADTEFAPDIGEVKIDRGLGAGQDLRNLP